MPLYYCCVILGTFLLHHVNGVPHLAINDKELRSDHPHTLCRDKLSFRNQWLSCRSGNHTKQSSATHYTWFYCHGCQDELVVARDVDRLSLKSDILLEGMYSCQIPGEGVSSVFICKHARGAVIEVVPVFTPILGGIHPCQANIGSGDMCGENSNTNDPRNNDGSNGSNGNIGSNGSNGSNGNNDNNGSNGSNGRNGTNSSLPDSDQASAQGQPTVKADRESDWKIVHVIATSVVAFLLLLTVVITLATVCFYRKWKCRGSHHQTEDYGAVDNLEIDTFHSIPYRRDGLPECPISLHTDGGAGTSRKRGRLPITWPPSSKRSSHRTSSSGPSPCPTPNMTWYYSRGQPLPVLSSPSSSSVDGEDDCQLLLSDSQQRTKRWGMVVTEEGGWEGVVRGRGRPEERVSEAVAMGQFEKAVASKYKDSMLGFQTEFMSLYGGTERSVSVAKRRENRSKNCFSNFYPYDDCRVVLQPVPVHGHRASLEHNDYINASHNDYINASYIDGFSRPRKFITTQVPLPHTVIEFWQMVWQERAVCLVLLTLAREEGRGSPGERYCSDDVGTWCIGPFLVSTTHKTQCAHHTVRHISIQVPGSAPVEVVQLQTCHLSRQSVQHMAASLLSFHRRFSELCPRDSTLPIVVHCSTGAGLSGVFVAVDRLLEEVKAGQGGGVNVWGVVNSLRQQRPRMVATMEQYVLVHEVLLEWVRWGHTETPVSRLTTTAPADCQFLVREGEGFLETLFKAAGPVRPDPDSEQEPAGGCLPCAHPLWISHSASGILGQSRTVPYHRPILISGYWPGSGWLVTNSPSRSSVSQFWRTVVNKKCAIVIDFSPHDKERYQYWPDGVSSATLIAGQYAIHRGREEDMAGDMKTISLTIENLLSGQTHVVSQFLLLDWTGDVSQQLCSAIDTILRAQNSTMHTPILLHCSDGVTECGVVCVVMVAVEQGLAEGLVDIPSAVRKIRTQLPAAICSLDEMKLVLKAVTAILNKRLC